jgi:acyl phosphate:glycerol-3-phosphate acyltransferase
VTLDAVLVLSLSYLLGSIPFSYLVARRRGVDVRQVGSGNVGATNVMRSVGKAAGLAAFALDFLKGMAASLLAVRLSPEGPLPAMAAVTAVLGHMYPVWLRFRGGKGVATGAGAFLPLAAVPTALGLVAFVVVLALTRYASLASIAGTITLAALALLLGYPESVARAAAAAGLLILWKHRANLRRVAEGTESRIGTKAGGSA